MTPSVKVRVNMVRMVLAIAGFLAVVIYGVFVVSAQDPYWFTGRFEGTPDRIMVYKDGQKTEMLAGEVRFQGLANAVMESLNSGVAQLSAIGLTQSSVQDAYELYFSLEVFFEKPAKLHTWFNTGHPTQLLFPITGRHSEMSRVFLGVNGKYMSNAPVLKNTAPLREALQSLGY